jgi:hypothetical protein
MTGIVLSENERNMHSHIFFLKIRSSLKSQKV